MPDWRSREHRRAVFQDFYEFHLQLGAHPGCVYFLMPYLREHAGWGEEEALWFAFLNGNTQNPVTSLLLMNAGPGPDHADDVVAFWRANYGRLAFDTDRRYHKKALEQAIAGYLALAREYGSQANLWRSQSELGWERLWFTATAIPTFGRLSAWSYLEYVRIMGGHALDVPDLMLNDMGGSRSHRNGLCIVTGNERFDWHASNPGSSPHLYTREVVDYLAKEGARLLTEAKVRASGHPWENDVAYLTLESTLCTYKGWHRPNRRYPGVYHDMLYDRIRAAEKAWPENDLGVFWDARRDRLPEWARLEDNPGDPGVHPTKQNWYRETGEIPVMGHRYSKYWSGFDAGVQECRWGRFRP